VDIEPAEGVEGLEIVFKGWYEGRAEGGVERVESGESLSEVRQIRVSVGGRAGERAWATEDSGGRRTWW
jgi:hypothetical protein